MEHNQYDIDKEVMARIKWWKLGSKDDDEHGYRQMQSNFSIKASDLKGIHKESS